MKNSTIPLIIMATFFAVSIEVIVGLHYFLSLNKIPLAIWVPVLGSAISWIGFVLLSVLGIGLTGFFIYANESEAVF
jgi:hypothetical protein